MSIISAHKATKKDVENVMVRCLRTNSVYGNKFLPLGRKDNRGDYCFVLGSGKENRFVTLLGAPRPYEKDGKVTDSNKFSMGITISTDEERKFFNGIDEQIIKEINANQKNLSPDNKEIKENYMLTLLEKDGYSPMLYVKFNVDNSKVYSWNSGNKGSSLISYREIINGDKAMVILKLDRVTIHKNRMKLDCLVKDIYINRESTNEFL